MSEISADAIRRVRFVVVNPSDPRVPAGIREEYEGSRCSILLDTASGAVVGIDGGEPEDQTLGRDWSWVPDALNAVADECDRLRARVAELRGENALLRTAVPASPPNWAPDAADVGRINYTHGVTAGDVRAARAALAKGSQ